MRSTNSFKKCIPLELPQYCWDISTKIPKLLIFSSFHYCELILHCILLIIPFSYPSHYNYSKCRLHVTIFWIYEYFFNPVITVKMKVYCINALLINYMIMIGILKTYLNKQRSLYEVDK